MKLQTIIDSLLKSAEVYSAAAARALKAGGADAAHAFVKRSLECLGLARELGSISVEC